MTRDAMNRLVGSELEHIPDWPGEHQSELRMIYALRRRASLGKNAVGTKAPGEVMRESVASVRKNNPSATLYYDAGFFV
jgi:hypothetical protein